MTLKESILQEAVNLTVKFGIGSLTRRRVAKAAGSATGTINYHFGSMDALREAVFTHAIQQEHIPLLSMYAGVPKVARRLTPDLRQKIATHIAGK